MDSSIYRLRYRDILTLCVIALLALGVVMVQSASMRITGQLQWQWTPAGIAQLKLAGLALFVYWLVGRFDYRWLARGTFWRGPILWMTIVSAALCLLVLVPGLGKNINGAKRWLKFAPLQPSELGKYAVVLFLAYSLAFRPFDLTQFKRGFLPMLIPVGIITLLVVIQDFGTAALIAISTIAMCLAGCVRLRHLAVVTVPAMAIGFWFVRHKEYRWRRIIAFMDPYSAPQKEGYHMIQSLLSFSTGGIFGRGLGNGIQKLGYLPEDTTDFIFAVICEELGLFGAMLTIALYLGIIFVAWQIVRRNRDSFGRLLAFGIATMVGLQALINIAVATVSVPTKGLSLPLVSAGGSGLVITCAALGLLYSISRFLHENGKEEETALWEMSSMALAGAL